MQTLQKIPATFLSLFLRKWNKPTNFGQLWWLLFLPLIFSLSLCCSHSPVDRLRKNEDSQHVSIFSWKFPHLFVCSLQKPIGSHWFRKFLLELLSLSFFIKWWNSEKPFFFCISMQYFCETFFLKTNTIEIYLIYWKKIPCLLGYYPVLHLYI